MTPSWLSLWVLKLSFFLFYVVAYVVRFDSQVWILKSDIIRPRYELFNAHCHSCLSLLSLSHTITFCIMALALIFGIKIFLAHIVAYVVSFDSHIRTLKSDIIRPRYELFNAHGHSWLSLPSLSNESSIFFCFNVRSLSCDTGLWKMGLGHNRDSSTKGKTETIDITENDALTRRHEMLTWKPWNGKNPGSPQTLNWSVYERKYNGGSQKMTFSINLNRTLRGL